MFWAWSHPTYSRQCQSRSGNTIPYNQKPTYIQKESITKDEAIYAFPDEYYDKYGVNVSGLGKFLFKYAVRHLVNRKVINIRNREW